MQKRIEPAEEKHNIDEISAQVLKEFTWKCIVEDRNDKKNNPMNELQQELQLINNIEVETVVTLSCEMINALDKALVVENKSEDNDSIYEHGIKMMSDKIRNLQCQNALNLTRLEEHARKEETWMKKQKEQKEQEMKFIEMQEKL